jgi:hypothetical protein
MQLSQISVQYLPEADRLLMRVKSTAGELYEVWLTRRLMLRWWPHAQTVVQSLGVSVQSQRLAPTSVPTPEAKTMMAETAKQTVLAGADFKTPFDANAKTQPLGQEPLLAVEVQMSVIASGAQKQLRLILLDAQRRQVQLQLAEPLAIAVRELLEQGLSKAQWGLLLGEATGSRVELPEGVERVLN